MRIDLWWPVTPKPSVRPRITTMRGFGRVYYPAEYNEYKQTLALHCQSLPLCRTLAPVEMIINFTMPRPKTPSIEKRGYMKPDLDNVIKPVMDAITQSERVWYDDCQVVSINATKKFATFAYPVGISATISWS